ncbi:MAG: hypothetical protein LCH63_10420 [Candidatus Melainabacteria bacterium]|nr:hypothetical protein [Candidatus Melainabacteria bacterium]
MAEGILNEHQRLAEALLGELRSLSNALRIEDPRFHGFASVKAAWKLDDGYLEATLTALESGVVLETSFQNFKTGRIQTERVDLYCDVNIVVTPSAEAS